MGGGERLVLTMAQALGADLAYAYREASTYEDDAFPAGTLDLRLPPALRRPRLRTLAMPFWFSRARAAAARYDTRVFSGVAAPFAAPRKGSGRNIFYCHTPPRFLFDMRDHFERRAGWSLPAQRAALGWFERNYRRAVERMDLILTNSRTTQERIRRYLGRDSVVVHPPCDTGRFVWQGQGDFYLSTARLTGLKRVDVIVDAFLRMPDRRLVVASGGEDLERLKARAAGAPNIEFLGWVDEARLVDLIGNAIATIYVPREEDFGMSPVESMSAGKPVIGVAEGGLLETVVDGRTGTLLPRDFDAAALAEAVSEMDASRALSMRAACEARASEFDVEHFVSSLRAAVGQARG